MEAYFGWTLPAGVTLADIDDLDTPAPIMPPMSLEDELAMIDACFDDASWVDPWLVGLPPAPVASSEPFLPDSPDEQEEQPELAKRRKVGRSFFYYHQDCGTWLESQQYESVPVAECAPGTICCGCWGNLHDAPAVLE